MKNPDELTYKQKVVLATIELHWARHGNSPTFHEIRDVSKQSVCNIQWAVNKLMRLGYIHRPKKWHDARNFFLTGKRYDWSSERRG